MKQWLPRHWISDNERQWSLGWRKGCLSCCLERKFPDHRTGQGAQSRGEGAGSQEAPWPRAESQGGKIKQRDCQGSHSFRQAQVCTWVWAKYRGRERTIPQPTWEGAGLAKIILLPTSQGGKSYHPPDIGYSTQTQLQRARISPRLGSGST